MPKEKNRCVMCAALISKQEKVCAECFEEWSQLEADLQPVRDKANAAQAKLQPLLRACASAQIALREAQRAEAAAHSTVDVLKSGMAQLLEGELGIQRLELGSWDCVHSVVEICVYDVTHDHNHVSCIFCGDPEDRY